MAQYDVLITYSTVADTANEALDDCRKAVHNPMFHDNAYAEVYVHGTKGAVLEGDLELLYPPKQLYQWARKGDGYEVSTKGNARFSPFNAIVGNRSIEEIYQCDIKGYQPKGRDWKLGKGKASLIAYPNDQQYQLYLSLWRLWALQNLDAMQGLAVDVAEKNHLLTDMFASTDINQARALAQILNEWFT